MYWGFEVKTYGETIKNFIRDYSKHVIIATSRKGSLLKQEEADLLQKIREKNKILLLFGSPSLGLFEIFKKNGLILEDWADFIINFVNEQGTHTIRTEEAINSTLAILNYILS